MCIPCVTSLNAATDAPVPAPTTAAPPVCDGGRGVGGTGASVAAFVHMWRAQFYLGTPMIPPHSGEVSTGVPDASSLTRTVPLSRRLAAELRA